MINPSMHVLPKKTPILVISCNFQKVSEGEMLVKIQPTTVGILLIYDYLISYFDKYERSRTPDAYIMPRHKWVKVL